MNNNKKPLRVAIIEDDPVIADLTGMLIDKTERMACCGIFNSFNQAFEKLEMTNPDVVVTDINLPGKSGIECVRHFKETIPNADFLMFTVFEDNNNLFEALVAGASGYLLKEASQDELIEAIFAVKKGESPMSGSIARKVVGHFHKMDKKQDETQKLSMREKEILDFLSQGMLYKEIAESIGIKLPTVNWHIRNIYDKLHVHSRAQAVAKYLGSGRD